MRAQKRHASRPASRAGFTLSGAVAAGTFQPGTPGFLFWQCREAGLSALEAWESCAGKLTRWQGNRKRLLLLQDVGVDLNAFYDRASFSFFHRTIGSTILFSGESTDVVSHEVGHGLLDSIRPDLWDAPFLETGAFHEAFGDCVAVLTALSDRETRQKLLAATPTLRQRNFVESTAEQLSDGIRRLVPTHSAAEPRHAFNTFQFQIPETLPDDGGPGALINEVHSFGMLFSGCFYDLIAAVFGDLPAKNEAGLLKAAQTAGALLVGGAKSALLTPRFFQAVGRAMVFADDQLNAGANRDRIRIAFLNHNILLGANAMLAPAAILAGAAPSKGRAASLGAATRRDLLARLGAGRGARLSVEAVEVSGRRFTRALHTQDVPLGALDRGLKGVTAAAPMPVLVGESGGRAALVGHLPEPVSTEREVQAFVRSLLHHGRIEFAAPKRAVAAKRGVAAEAMQAAQATHRVRSVGGKKVLERIRFHCGCV
jgi:hypothetical protein